MSTKSPAYKKFTLKETWRYFGTAPSEFKQPVDCILLNAFEIETVPPEISVELTIISVFVTVVELGCKENDVKRRSIRIKTLIENGKNN